MSSPNQHSHASLLSISGASWSIPVCSPSPGPGASSAFGKHPQLLKHPPRWQPQPCAFSSSLLPKPQIFALTSQRIGGWLPSAVLLVSVGCGLYLDNESVKINTNIVSHFHTHKPRCSLLFIPTYWLKKVENVPEDFLRWGNPEDTN